MMAFLFLSAKIWGMLNRNAKKMHFIIQKIGLDKKYLDLIHLIFNFAVGCSRK